MAREVEEKKQLLSRGGGGKKVHDSGAGVRARTVRAGLQGGGPRFLRREEKGSPQEGKRAVVALGKLVSRQPAHRSGRRRKRKREKT